jgi:hypothetical protein
VNGSCCHYASQVFALHSIIPPFQIHYCYCCGWWIGWARVPRVVEVALATLAVAGKGTGALTARSARGAPPAVVMSSNHYTNKINHHTTTHAPNHSNTNKHHQQQRQQPRIGTVDVSTRVHPHPHHHHHHPSEVTSDHGWSSPSQMLPPHRQLVLTTNPSSAGMAMATLGSPIHTSGNYMLQKPTPSNAKNEGGTTDDDVTMMTSNDVDAVKPSPVPPTTYMSDAGSPINNTTTSVPLPGSPEPSPINPAFDH